MTTQDDAMNARALGIAARLAAGRDALARAQQSAADSMRTVSQIDLPLDHVGD